MALIECKNLSIGYDGRSIKSNINFEINSGDYVCIIGSNGSGKSTLVKNLLHLQHPLDGKILFSPDLLPSQTGYLPQATDTQKNFPASISEVVLSGRLNHLGKHIFYTPQDKSIALKNMKKLGVDNIRNRSFQELSGGQRQRVLLARALCSAEKLLVLDEPVAGLDPQVTEQMYGIIEKINKEGMTVIMVSHDIPAAMKYASHIMFLDDNDFFFGTAQEYLQKYAWR